MYTRMLNLWERFLASFWFVPAVMMIAATLGAVGLIRFDATIGRSLFDAYQIFELSPPAARSILSSIVGAMVTSTGVVFSMTIVALSLASSQFGSRLIRTFRNRKSTRFTLGIFVSTSLFCILVLASIREVEDYRFVPTTSVVMGILLAILCLSTLIYYIHDISNAIQAPSVIQSSAHDLGKAIDRMFPERIGEDGDQEVDSKRIVDSGIDFQNPDFSVQFNRAGYAQAIANETIMELACKYNVVIRLVVQPGDFIQDGYKVAEVFLTDRTQPDFSEDDRRSSFVRELRGCLLVDFSRTPTQDVRYAFNELVEIAVRALSPGINDPYTALTCIEHIQAALLQMKQRKTPSAYRLDKEHGVLRVIAQPVTLGDCTEGSLGMIADYVAGSPKVKARLERALDDVRQA